jgi:hypothetical protein
MEKSKIRINRTWVALIDGRTKENEEYISHTACMVKFEMPENEATIKRNITNNVHDVIWFYLNHLDQWSTMSEDRMINAADLPEEIVKLIPYKNIPWTEENAIIENYQKRSLYGFKN